MKTPIEKAAEYLIDQFSDRPLTAEMADDIADCIRRVLGEEVPIVEPNDWPMNEERRYRERRSAGHRKCRRDIGLEDSNDR